MQRLVTAAQMQDLDRRATAEHGIPGLTLMENAGRAVVEFMEKHLGNLAGTQPLVVCGKGNNGGDGFVVARLLLEKGAKPDCILVGKSSDLTGDALANYQRLTGSGFAVREPAKAADIGPLFGGRKVVIDAIFGTGLTRAPAGLAAEAIRLINCSGAFVVAIDLPSGLQSDTGKSYEPCVRANLTVTMALSKVGLWLYPGRACVGAVEVGDIGMPEALTAADMGSGVQGFKGTGAGTVRPGPLETTPEPQTPGTLSAETFLLDAERIGATLPRRIPEGHKGTFGAALIIAGSRNFSGAAVLAGSAAVRSGCGLIRLAIPAGVADVVSSDVVEAVKIPLPQTESQALSPAATESLLELAADAQAVAIGPGIGTDPRTKELELDFLAEVEQPTVIDADGINNLAGHVDLLSRTSAQLVLTPHPGEFARLAGLKAGDVNADRVGISRKFATEKKVVLVLKGASTVVAAPDGRVFVNPTGNSGLAKGGTGDVLTGLIAGLMAQGMSPLDAACAGVFLHGLAADIAVQTLTEYCLAAGDLPHFLPQAFAAVLGQGSKGSGGQGVWSGHLNPGTPDPRHCPTGAAAANPVREP